MSTATQPRVSVVICTRNPRMDVLEQVLTALRNQTLPAQAWDLTLIDNNSDPGLRDTVDLPGLPNARVVDERRPGLTAARHAGIRSTTGQIVVFVDDDNVLEPDYLERAVDISRSHPMLGAWGGQLLPDPSVSIPAELEPFVSFIGIRYVASPRWASFPDPESTPFGAGMCVARRVADTYAVESVRSPLRLGLDVNSGELLRCGDLDLAWTSCDVGLAIGVFPELRLIHQLDRARFELKYAREVVIGHEISYAMLRFAREGRVPELPPRDRVSRLKRLAIVLRLIPGPPTPTLFDLARDEGMRQAVARFDENRFPEA